MNSNEDTRTVTTTYTMSNGKTYVVVSEMESEDLRRARDHARTLASNHMPIIVNVVEPVGSIEYLNPNQVASINIAVTDR